MTTDLVLDTLEHAIWTRQRDGVQDLSGLVHHTDAGNTFSFALTERLVETGVDASADPSETPTTTLWPSPRSGSTKKLLRPEGPWRGVEHVEIETLNWVDWFNNERSHEALFDLSPVAAERLQYAERNELQPLG